MVPQDKNILLLINLIVVSLDKFILVTMIDKIFVIFLLLTISIAQKIEPPDLIIGSYLQESLSEYRKLVFRQNALYVQKHNSDPTKTWKLKLHPQFAALTPEEVNHIYFSFDVIQTADQQEFVTVEGVQKYRPQQSLKYVYEIYGNSTQKYINYADIARTPVRNQGACNSGYAYSAIDVLNIQSRLRRPNSQLFSVQYVIDCAKYLGRSNGCIGGSIFSAYLFNHMIGVIPQKQYPQNYKTIKNGIEQRCKKSNAKHYKVGMFSWQGETQKNCIKIKIDYLNRTRVSSVPVYASSPQFYYYESGIINNCSVPQDVQNVRPNHAAILLGFKQSAVIGQNYLILKNSWGHLWGEGGYFRVYDPPESVQSGSYNRCYVCTQRYTIQHFDGWARGESIKPNIQLKE